MKIVNEIRKQFASLGIDALLVTGSQNRRYLTGFTGSSGVVFISESEAKLVTDFRYTEQAKAQAPDFEITLHTKNVAEVIANLVQTSGIKRLGIEKDHLTYSEFLDFQHRIPAELVPTSQIIERFRMVKSKKEIDDIKTAVAIADAAFEHILGYIKPGISEIDVSNELEWFMRKEGAKSSAYDTIVASGKRSALPHGVASQKVIEEGDIVTIDVGAYYEGYRSDMTRTIAVGKPDDKLRAIYQIVLEALKIGEEFLRPGVKAAEVDGVIRRFIKEQGYGEQFGHGAGHGIGLDIHEEPFFSSKSDKVMLENMVMTIEPGIYLANLGGVRIEDSVVVTENGCEILTQSPKELIII